MDYSFNYGNKTQDHGLNPRHIDVGEKETIYRSQGHAPIWLSSHHWCRKHEVYGHWSGGSSQQ